MSARKSITTQQFQQGSLVFAKVRGYPPWPARVESWMPTGTPKSKAPCYEVFYFGTHQMGFCKPGELFDYESHKDNYGKRKSIPFMKAMNEVPADGPAEEPTSPKHSECETNSTEVISKSPELNGKSPPRTPQRKRKKLSVKITTPIKKLKVAEPELASNDPKPVMSNELSDQDKPIQISEVESASAVADELIDQDELQVKISNAKSSCAESDELRDKDGPQQYSHLEQDEEDASEIDSEVSDENIKVSFTRQQILQLLSINSLPEAVRCMLCRELLQRYIEREQAAETQLTQDRRNLLKTELQLLMCEQRIKTALKKMEPELTSAIAVMEEIKSLPINNLMLKKQPLVLNTMKKLSSFTGWPKQCLRAREGEDVFKEKAQVLREKASELFGAFQSLFELPQSDNFMMWFGGQVEELRSLVPDKEQFLTLTEEPAAEVITVQSDEDSRE